MRRNDRRQRRNSFGRTIVIVAVLVCSSAAGVAAQSPSASAVTVGAQIRGGGYFAMPEASVLLTAGFPVASHFVIAPRIGGTYIFFPLSGLSGDWYVPVGVELRFPETQLGIVLENLVAIDNPLGEGGVSAGIEGYVPFAKPGKSIFSVAMEAGTAVFWNTANRPLILVSLSASLRYEYKVKSGS